MPTDHRQGVPFQARHPGPPRSLCTHEKRALTARPSSPTCVSLINEPAQLTFCRRQDDKSAHDHGPSHRVRSGVRAERASRGDICPMSHAGSHTPRLCPKRAGDFGVPVADLGEGIERDVGLQVAVGHGLAAAQRRKREVMRTRCKCGSSACWRFGPTILEDTLLGRSPNGCTVRYSCAKLAPSAKHPRQWEETTCPCK